MTTPTTPLNAPRTVEVDDTARVLGVATVALSAVLLTAGIATEIAAALVARQVSNLSTLDDVNVVGAAAVGVIATGYLVLLLPTWIVTCLWARAVRKVSPWESKFTYGTGATFTCWVIPVVNLILPAAVISDLQRWTVPDRRRLSIGTWWTLWLGALLAGRVGDYMFSTQPAGGPAGPVIVCGVVTTLAMLGAFWCWIRIVLRITQHAADE